MHAAPPPAPKHPPCTSLTARVAGRKHTRAASGFSSLGSDLDFSEATASGLPSRTSEARPASLDAQRLQPGDAAPPDSFSGGAKPRRLKGGQQAQSAELIPPELR